jgi:hypothetical protein
LGGLGLGLGLGYILGYPGYYPGFYAEPFLNYDYDDDYY